MKSTKLHFLLVVLFCGLNCLAVNLKSDPVNLPVNFTSQLDSLYNQDSSSNLEFAKSVINLFESEENQNLELTNEELKRVVVSYALLKENKKAIEYAEKYIKTVYDVQILNHDAFNELKETNAYKSLAKKYLPEINFWLLFFFSAGVIGVFLSILVNLRKNGDVQANLLISLFVFFHSVFLIHLCLFFSKFNFRLPHSLYASTSFSFLYGPLLYFYFVRITKKYVFKLRDLLHLVPSVLLFLYFLPIYISTEEEKMHLMFNRDQILHSTLVTIVLLKSLSLVVYSYLVFRVYQESKEKEEKPHKAIVSWQRNMMLLNIAFTVAYIIYGIALMNIVMVDILIYPQIVLMAVIILYAGYTAYVQPRVFSKKYLFDKVFSDTKYIKSGLTEGFSKELKDALIKAFEEDKVFKQSDISLIKLSEHIGTSRHHLSQVINEHFQMNFFALVNRYRVYEAMEILKNDVNRNLNIIDVAYDVGFNNKVTFNKAFKAETQMTPSEFVKNANGFRLQTK